MALVSLLGDTLITKAGTPISTADALEGAEHLLLYFSAHWCPPCRRFTPMLSKYAETHSSAKKFKVVFVSSDQDAAQFTEYFNSMSWDLAIPFENVPARRGLNMKFKVRGIPTLIILDKDAQVVTADAVSSIASDPSASEFPYRPKSAWEILAGSRVVDHEGKQIPLDSLRSLQGVGLYFSAHWCPPCRGFTPSLVQWYNKHIASPEGALHGKADIIFVSSDRSEKDFNEYYGEMPWKAVPLTEMKTKQALSEKFQVEGIPSLVFIDGEGNVLTKDGRTKVLAEPDGFPWPKQPVGPLSSAAEDINDIPTAVLFVDNVTNEDAEAAAAAAFIEVAEEVFNSPDKTRMQFAIASEGDDAVDQVRSFLGKAHTSDKNGPTNIRMTIIDVQNGTKYMLKSGDGKDLFIPTADEIRTLVQAVLRGAAEGVNIKA